MAHWSSRCGRILLGVLMAIGAGCDPPTTSTVCAIDPAYKDLEPCFYGSGVFASVGFPKELADIPGIAVEVCLNESCSTGTLQSMGLESDCEVRGPVSVPRCVFEHDGLLGAPNSFLSLFVYSTLAANGETLKISIHDPAGRTVQRLDFQRRIVYDSFESRLCDRVACRLSMVSN